MHRGPPRDAGRTSPSRRTGPRPGAGRRGGVAWTSHTTSVSRSPSTGSRLRDDRGSRGTFRIAPPHRTIKLHDKQISTDGHAGFSTPLRFLTRSPSEGGTAPTPRLPVGSKTRCGHLPRNPTPLTGGGSGGARASGLPPTYSRMGRTSSGAQFLVHPVVGPKGRSGGLGPVARPASECRRLEDSHPFQTKLEMSRRGRIYHSRGFRSKHQQGFRPKLIPLHSDGPQVAWLGSQESSCPGGGWPPPART